jgi:hypothetical protein
VTGSPTTTLRGDEYDVLGHFAEGHDAGVIANLLGLDLARVQGILTRKCQMKRSKARELVEGGADIATDATERAALSPLTAPIAKATKKPTPPPPEPRHGAPPAPANGGEPAPVPVFTEPGREPLDLHEVYEPPADPVTRMLNEGVAAIADKLCGLVTGLVDAALEQQRAAHLRHLAAIKVELDAALAERAWAE